MQKDLEGKVRVVQAIVATIWILLLCAVGLPLSCALMTSSRNVSCKDLFPSRSAFVALNGGFQRVIGRRLCNNRVRLVNGSMGFAKFVVGDCSEKAAKEIAFARHLQSVGIRFLHVQAPLGIDLGKTLLPPGFHCNGNEKAEEFIGMLRNGGVKALDLVPSFVSSPEDVTRFFLRTDHHWNYEAAFISARKIADRLLEELSPSPSHVGEVLSFERWQQTDLPRWRLGSHGYRVGPLFAGVDDLSYFVPKKESAYLREEYLKDGKVVLHKGGFVKATMNRKAISSPSIVSSGSFALHPKMNYPNCFVNSQAPVGKRILVIGDSFARPVPAYLNSVFQEVVLIDPRHFRECKPFRKISIVEYVKSMSPDAVVMLINPSSFYADTGDRGLGDCMLYDRVFEFGVKSF